MAEPPLFDVSERRIQEATRSFGANFSQGGRSDMRFRTTAGHIAQLRDMKRSPRSTPCKR